MNWFSFLSATILSLILLRHGCYAYLTHQQQQQHPRASTPIISIAQQSNVETESFSDKAILSLQEQCAVRQTSLIKDSDGSKKRCICPDDDDDDPDDKELLLEESLETIFAAMGSIWSLSSSTNNEFSRALVEATRQHSATNNT
jgi:hypothetical protein